MRGRVRSIDVRHYLFRYVTHILYNQDTSASYHDMRGKRASDGGARSRGSGGSRESCDTDKTYMGGGDLGRGVLLAGAQALCCRSLAPQPSTLNSISKLRGRSSDSSPPLPAQRRAAEPAGY